MRMTAALASNGNGKGDGDNQDKVAAAVNRIVEGLRGDAFDMAMDIGKETLLTEEGISRLIKMIRLSIFPIKALEAKVLFQVGQKPYGPMPRQSLEPMVSYIPRRKRWWNMVKQLGKSMVISDEMLGSFSFDHVGCAGAAYTYGADVYGQQHDL